MLKLFNFFQKLGRVILNNLLYSKDKWRITNNCEMMIKILGPIKVKLKNWIIL